MNLPIDFYKKVEDKNYLNYVLYSDTDSIYILIPVNIKNKNVDERIDLAGKTSKVINDKNLQFKVKTGTNYANIK
jgi:uncharacterized secreted protein with C-terminal beta-propeller domain